MLGRFPSAGTGGMGCDAEPRGEESEVERGGEEAVMLREEASGAWDVETGG